MKILGIDPGLNATGYGLITVHEQNISLLETGTIEPNKKDAFPVRVKKIYENLREVISEFHPDILVLEKLYAHYNHPTTAIVMGHVRGVICLLCAQEKLTFAEYSAKRIRKAVCGNGNAPKQQVRRVIGRALKINESKLPLDASDALALALGHIHLDKAISTQFG